MCSCRRSRPAVRAGGARRGAGRARAASRGPRWPRPRGRGGRSSGRRSAASSKSPGRPRSPRSTRTVSRRISRCRRTGLIQRAVAASPRLVSQPNAIGSRRSGRSRICCMNSPNSAGESLPVSTSVLPVRPGGKLSNASQETSTIRPTRVAPSPASSWTSAPPVSLPTRVTSSQVEAVEELRDQPGEPAQRQVGVGVHRVAVRAERQRRRDAPVVGGQVGAPVVPQRGVHQQPVQQHDGGPVAAGVLVVDRVPPRTRWFPCPVPLRSLPRSEPRGSQTSTPPPPRGPAPGPARRTRPRRRPGSPPLVQQVDQEAAQRGEDHLGDLELALLRPVPAGTGQQRGQVLLRRAPAEPARTARGRTSPARWPGRAPAPRSLDEDRPHGADPAGQRPAARSSAAAARPLSMRRSRSCDDRLLQQVVGAVEVVEQHLVRGAGRPRGAAQREVHQAVGGQVLGDRSSSSRRRASPRGEPADRRYPARAGSSAEVFTPDSLARGGGRRCGCWSPEATPGIGYFVAEQLARRARTW